MSPHQGRVTADAHRPILTDWHTMRIPTEPPHLRERNHFKALLADNPNYFGNLPDSPRPPVTTIVARTDYEQLIEIGYHSADERLVAVAHLPQAEGYGSEVTGSGSTEFIRFFISHDRGDTWIDYGVSSFAAFNLKSRTPTDPIASSASIGLPHALLNLPGPSIRLRAILSWQQCPPPDQPFWRPVWGNVLEREIVTRTTGSEDLNTGLTYSNSTQPPIDIVDASVGARRAYAYRDALDSHATELHADAFTALLGMQEDTDDHPEPQESPLRFCAIALDPNTPTSLVVIARLDRALGDDPWPQLTAQFVNVWRLGATEHQNARFLGSTSFSVTPGCAHGYLSARLPVDLSFDRRPGNAGPTVLRLRATLSNTRPLSERLPEKSTDPRQMAETTVFLPPGPAPVQGKLSIIGGIAVENIDTESGTTLPHARFAGSNLAADELGRACPFGGLIRLHGPALATGFSYSIEMRPVDGGPATTLKRPIRLKRADGTSWLHHPDPESGRFAYVPFEYNIEQLLGEWDSHGDQCHTVTLWTYQMEGKPCGMDSHRVQLANAAPECDLVVDAASPLEPGTNDASIVCTYRARDPWFGYARLEVEPNLPELPPNHSHTQTPPRGMHWRIPARHMDVGRHQVSMTVRNRAILDSCTTGRQHVETLGLDDVLPR